MTKFKSTLCFVAAAALLAGCASFNANMYNAEKLTADGATTATHQFNQYYQTATNGATEAQLATLNSQRDELYAADRDLSKVLSVLDKARLDYAVNSTDANKTAVTAALQTVSDQSGNIVALVKTFIPIPTTPAKAKAKSPTPVAPQPVFAPITN